MDLKQSWGKPTMAQKTRLHWFMPIVTIAGHLVLNHHASDNTRTAEAPKLIVVYV